MILSLKKEDQRSQSLSSVSSLNSLQGSLRCFFFSPWHHWFPRHLWLLNKQPWLRRSHWSPRDPEFLRNPRSLHNIRSLRKSCLFRNPWRVLHPCFFELHDLGANLFFSFPFLVNFYSEQGFSSHEQVTFSYASSLMAILLNTTSLFPR